MDQIHNANACQIGNRSPQHSKANHNEVHMALL